MNFTQPSLRSRLFCAECGAFFPVGKQCSNCNHARATLDIPTEPGKPHWQYDLPGSPSNQMTFATIENRHAVIVAWRLPRRGEIVAPDGGIVALDLDEGNAIWSEPVGVTIEGGVAVIAMESLVIAGYGTRASIGAGTGGIIALDLKTGKERWRVPLPATVRCAPTVDLTRVYVTAGDGELYCLDTASPKILWHKPAFPQPVPMPASPVIIRDHGKMIGAIVATYGKNFDRESGKVIFLDERGERMWGPHDAGGNVLGTPIVADGVIYVPAFRAHPSTGTLAAFNARTGDAIWKSPFTVSASASENRSHNFSASPLVDGDTLYIGSQNHRLYILAARTGEKRGETQVAHGISTAPSAIHGLIVFGETDGTLNAFDPVANEIVWKYALGSPLLTTPLVADDAIIAASESGKVVALPWHLGRYEWAGERLQTARHFAQAGECLALAAEQETADVNRKHQYIEQAQELFRQASMPERSARLLGAQLWAQPEQIARELESAANLVVGRDRALAAQLLFEASEYFDQTDLFDQAHECERQASMIDPAPRLTLRCLTAERFFEPDESAPLMFELKNRGKTLAQVFIRLGGVIARTVKTMDALSIEPGECQEIEMELTPTGPGNLTVELMYRDARGRNLGLRRTFSLNVRSAPQIVTEQDAGAVILKNKEGTAMPRVRVKGMVGLLRVESF